MVVPKSTGSYNQLVRKVIILSPPIQHPLSSVANNTYCLARDMKGFQYQVDLMSLPPRVTLNMIQPNQVWWVEKRSTLVRLFAYAGILNKYSDPNVFTSLTPESYARFSLSSSIKLGVSTISGNTWNQPYSQTLNWTTNTTHSGTFGNIVYSGGSITVPVPGYYNVNLTVSPSINGGTLTNTLNCTTISGAASSVYSTGTNSINLSDTLYIPTVSGSFSVTSNVSNYAQLSTAGTWMTVTYVGDVY